MNGVARRLTAGRWGMALPDDIGSHGEFVFCTRIMNFCKRGKPYFRPRFLGEKAQTYDFLVELVDAGRGGPFFFVQVKATRQGYTSKQPRRLKVSMSGEDVQRFSTIPAPTYLVGIDEPAEVGYILAILEGMKDTIPSLPTYFPIDCTTIPRLFQEVEQFWAGRDMARRHSVFFV
jgi:hypothetical protein